MEHLVRLDVGDAYEDLPAKVIAAVRWAKDAEYDYVYKVDTDVFMLPSKFIAFLKVNAIDKGVDWMGSENKMYRAAPGDVTNSGFVCGLSLDWHFGKCSRPDLNTKPYAGVNPVSVDGGHGYLLSRKAMWAVSDYCFKHEAELERDRYVNIYEDQLLAHILVKQGFLPVDFSGINAFDVPGIDGDKADDACAVLEGEPGKEIGRRVAAMQAYRFESGVNLYETADGWHPKAMDAEDASVVAAWRRHPTVRLGERHAPQVGVLPRSLRHSTAAKGRHVPSGDHSAKPRVQLGDRRGDVVRGGCPLGTRQRGG